MMKSSLFVILGAMAIGACSSPQSMAKDADAAQHDADEKKAYSNEENRVAADETQRKADEQKAEDARDTQKKNNAAQGEANQAWSDANQSLLKARSETRDDSNKKLAILDKQFADLKPKVVRKYSQAGSTTIVNGLSERSEAVRKSIDSLQNTTADSIEPVKSTIAQRLTDYENALKEAQKGI